MRKESLKIAVSNDQIFRPGETDIEQIMSSMSAVGSLPGVDVELLLPLGWRMQPSDAASLAYQFDVPETFTTRGQRSLFPSFRALEKSAHALACLSSRALKECDVLYTRNLPTALAVLAFSKKPVVYETFRPWPDQKPILVPLLRKMVRNPRFLGAVTHSRLAGRSFIEIGMAEEKLLTAHNGYSPKRMQPVLSRDEARQQLNLPKTGRIVSYVGHVMMKKGLDILLRLAAELPDVLFVVVGSEGPGEVEREAEKLPNVRIVPWQPFRATVPYLYASDVLFIPPTAGPLTKVGNTVLPIKTFLYMASKRAIFGPATPDLAEVLTHDRNAVLVTPDDPAAALTALSHLLEDAAFRERIAQTAFDDVSEMTWEARAARIVAFIEERRNALSQ